jgi:glycosyltransferase involved in cell wall biosynthesis
MGTASNFRHLAIAEPAVRRVLQENPHVTFRLVSNGSWEGLAAHPRVEQVAWSADSELGQLRGFSVGLMPLVDDAWSRGKCGFKLLQYMAVGTPVIASAVGVNPEILQDGQVGMLARTSEEWYLALRRLVADATLRGALGDAGRERVVSAYSIDRVVPTYLDILEQVSRSGSVPASARRRAARVPDDVELG